MRPFSIGAAVIALAAATVSAQEKSENNIISALKDRAVVIEVTARIVQGDDDSESWNSESSKVTIPGRPVTLKLVGSNVVVAAQFTPYKKDDGHTILVAQGQVWVSTKDQGILYYTTIQTIPLEFGERVYFFPLGQKHADSGSRIEVQLVLKPYIEEDAAKPQTPAQAAPGPVQPPSTTSSASGQPAPAGTAPQPATSTSTSAAGSPSKPPTAAPSALAPSAAPPAQAAGPERKQNE